MGVVSGCRFLSPVSQDNFPMLVRREVVNGCTLHSQRPNAGGLFLDQDIHDRQHDAEKEVTTGLGLGLPA